MIMKKILFTLFIGLLLLTSCQRDMWEEGENPLSEVGIYDDANSDDNFQELNLDNMDYREAMRQWVIKISTIAKENNPDFAIIPQNCSLLFTDTGYADGIINQAFIDGIDGVGQEGIFYGNDRYNKARDEESKKQITQLLNAGIDNGLSVVSINYCDDIKKVDDAMDYDNKNGYISFVSSSFDLMDIPMEQALNENSNDIINLRDAKNCLFMLNPAEYDSLEDYINALMKTNYDLLIIDAFFYDDFMLSTQDVEKLKTKENGAKRIVISYLSIGEAEDYRYYWQDDYNENPPQWMLTENPNWEGNYPVKYWDAQWQSIIVDDAESYLNRIISAGFDGVYLDIVDGYQTFEDLYDNE